MLEKKKSFSSSWKLPGGFRRPSLARLLHHHNSSSRAAASKFGAALHDIARCVLKKEKAFKTLCWRRCCCSRRYLTELQRLISGNSVRHDYVSTSSLSHLDSYRKVWNTFCFFFIASRSSCIPCFRGQAWLGTGSALNNTFKNLLSV